VVFAAASLVAVSVAGCGGIGDGAFERTDERPASVAQAVTPPPRVDCNGEFVQSVQLTARQMVVAYGINKFGQRVPRYGYQKSVQGLLDTLYRDCTSANGNQNPTTTPPGAYAACDQYNYTLHISTIPGASGYYYMVQDTSNPAKGPDWIAIPIVDITTASKYPSYPGATVIHTPLASHLPVPPPPGGAQQTSAVMLEDDASRPDHTDLWNIVTTDSFNTSNVSGKVNASPCIEIVDGSGNFLDFAAELEEHDPDGCPTCIQ
jgi:hypothetical protein